MEVSRQFHALGVLSPVKEPLVPVEEDGLQSRPDSSGEKENHFPRSAGNQTQVVQPTTYSLY
jgi:hypothetical protein